MPAASRSRSRISPRSSSARAKSATPPGSAAALGHDRHRQAGDREPARRLGRIEEALPGIIEDLPQGMSIAKSYDSSVFIDRSIKAVFQTIIEAIVLVVLIIFIFLRSARAT
jgi:hypothetical protein